MVVIPAGGAAVFEGAAVVEGFAVEVVALVDEAVVAVEDGAAAPGMHCEYHSFCRG